MRLLVTAGPTREYIDPVRFISNGSTGKMGYAVAAVAAARGHSVRLITGPVSLRPPEGVPCYRVVSAAEMLGRVQEHLAWCEALVMTAAVADWRPKAPFDRKQKKQGEEFHIVCERTEDVLETIRPGKKDRIFVGFAAETDDLEAEGERKRKQKGLDLVVANAVGVRDSGFGADTNRAVLLSEEKRERLPLMPKTELAERIVVWIEEALH